MPSGETTARRWFRPPTARARILGWYVALLAVALAGALFVQRTFLLGQVVEDADEALDQEIAELRQLADGVDPETGEPFGTDVDAIFDLFLSRNVGVEGEGVVTVIDGELYKSDVPGARYADIAQLAAQWTGVTTPVRDEVDTELGPVRFLAIPLEADGDVAGVFVAAIGLRRGLERVDDVIRLGALVYGSIFILTSAVAWLVAGEILKPLRTLGETARTIGETDLSRRIEVKGNDELADLSHTFNNMLDRLEDAFATQQRFIDDAGHELRTPITIIRGQLEVLGDDPEERRETTVLVTAELDRMSRIVEDLLVLAKAEQPDFIIWRPIDLGEFIQSIVRKSETLSANDEITAEPGVAVFYGDEQRLTQAVTNLVRNAIEHTPAGSRIVVAGSVTGDGAEPLVERTVAIRVTDDGPGIPEPERDRIFERFGRGTQGRRTTGGAGLGLAIAKAIAEGHQGALRLDEGSVGTSFTIQIPLHEQRPSMNHGGDEETAWVAS